MAIDKEQVIEQLKSDVPYLRARAIYLLGEEGYFDSDCIAAVRELLNDNAQVPMVGTVADVAKSYIDNTNAA